MTLSILPTKRFVSYELWLSGRVVNVLMRADLSRDGVGDGGSFAWRWGRRTRSERAWISSVKVLHSPPEKFALKKGAWFYDDALQSFMKMGEVPRFDVTKARQVVAAAIAGRSVQVDGEPVTMDCGIESAWYFLELLGRKAPLFERDVVSGNSSFKTLLELVSGAGVPCKIVYCESVNPETLSLPAICSVSPAHYVVLVKKLSRGKFLTIDPPYRTAVATSMNMAVAWSGYALVRK